MVMNMENYVIDGKITTITLEDGRIVKAMTSYLQNMVDNLEIDMDEAVLTWLEDEGYICNDEQEELEEKAKDNKVLASLKRNAKGERKSTEKKTRTVKENPVKEAVISKIAETVNSIAGATNVVIENKGKIITFSLAGEDYKIDLVQKRKPKNIKN